MSKRKADTGMEGRYKSFSMTISELSGPNCHTPISRYSLYKSSGPIVKQIQYNTISNDLENRPSQTSEVGPTEREIEVKKLRASLRRYKAINERCLRENENLVKQLNEGKKKEMLLQQLQDEVVSLYGELEASNTVWLPISNYSQQQVTETTINAIEVCDFDDFVMQTTQNELQTQLSTQMQSQDQTQFQLQLNDLPLVPYDSGEDVLNKNDTNLEYLQQIQQLQDENTDLREQIDQMKKEENKENYVSKEMYQNLLQQYNDLSTQNEELKKTILDLKKQKDMYNNLSYYSKEKLEARMIQLYAELKRRNSLSTHTSKDNK